jgi:hypothetical protein
LPDAALIGAVACPGNNLLPVPGGHESMTFWASCAVTLILSLLTAEFSELGPWLARRVVRLGARLVLDQHLSSQYGEEWLAGLEGTPGKLTPLAKALGILIIAVPITNWRYLDNLWICTIGLRRYTRSVNETFRYPWWLKVTRDARANAPKYNARVEELCHALRYGPSDHRAEALKTLEFLLEAPPPWAGPRRIVRRTLGRDLPTLRKALSARGYLP